MVGDVERLRQAIRGLRLGVTEYARMDAADTIEHEALRIVDEVEEALRHRCCGCPHRRSFL